MSFPSSIPDGRLGWTGRGAAQDLGPVPAAWEAGGSGACGRALPCPARWVERIAGMPGTSWIRRKRSTLFNSQSLRMQGDV